MIGLKLEQLALGGGLVRGEGDVVYFVLVGGFIHGAVHGACIHGAVEGAVEGLQGCGGGSGIEPGKPVAFVEDDGHAVVYLGDDVVGGGGEDGVGIDEGAVGHATLGPDAGNDHGLIVFADEAPWLLGLRGLIPFVEPVGRDKATALTPGLLEGTELVYGFGAGVDEKAESTVWPAGGVEAPAHEFDFIATAAKHGAGHGGRVIVAAGELGDLDAELLGHGAQGALSNSVTATHGSGFCKGGRGLQWKSPRLSESRRASSEQGESLEALEMPKSAHSSSGTSRRSVAESSEGSRCCSKRRVTALREMAEHQAWTCSPTRRYSLCGAGVVRVSGGVGMG